MRVRNRYDVSRTSKVVPLDLQILYNLAAAHVLQIPAVDTLQNLENSALRLVQTGVNARENRCPLLNQGLRRPNRRICIDIGDLFFRCRHYTLGGARQPAQKLEQNRAWRVKGHRHCQLAHIIYAWSRLNLCNLGNFDLLRLPADLRALELQKRCSVVDVGRVQQGPQSACSSRGEASNEVRQANSIGSTPRDELELDNPVELRHRVVALFPIPVQTNDF